MYQFSWGRVAKNAGPRGLPAWFLEPMLTPKANSGYWNELAQEIDSFFSSNGQEFKMAVAAINS